MSDNYNHIDIIVGLHSSFMRVLLFYEASTHSLVEFLQWTERFAYETPLIYCNPAQNNNNLRSKQDTSAGNPPIASHNGQYLTTETKHNSIHGCILSWVVPLIRAN